MHFSVRNYFIEFNEPFEGRINYMYLDIKGLVTIGIGNLFDVEKAENTVALKRVMDELAALPFVYKEKHPNAGKLATRTEIEAEWKRVKDKQDLAKKGAKAFKDIKITTLKLEDNAIDQLLFTKLNKMERELKNIPAFRQFEQWPADAQLALLSMAWATGVPKIRQQWVRLQKACEKQDFDDATRRCGILSVGNPGVIPRNRANRDLFKNAAAVIAGEEQKFAGIERHRLYYPMRVMKPTTIRG